ncbi:hypothetical protein VPHK225_0009 [Vibrio phage K225]|nr:hypothetical protein PODOV044v1_p0011 [Vibrio phage 23E28.1]QZI92080.1 hypothetical protein PODOV045v1_p0038 [Vibrio phage 69E27.1]
MANTLIDCRFDALRGLGYTGTVNDMLYAYWLAQGGTGGTLNDRWFSALGVLGQTENTLSDRWFEYLGSLGYVGRVNDRELEYWCGILNATPWNDGEGWNDPDPWND